MSLTDPLFIASSADSLRDETLINPPSTRDTAKAYSDLIEIYKALRVAHQVAYVPEAEESDVEQILDVVLKTSSEMNSRALDSEEYSLEVRKYVIKSLRCLDMLVVSAMLTQNPEIFEMDSEDDDVNE